MIFGGEIHRLHEPRKSDVRIAVNFFPWKKKTKENIRNNTALPMCHDDGKNIQIVSDKVDVTSLKEWCIFFVTTCGWKPSSTSYILCIYSTYVIMIYVMYNMFDS